VTGPPRTVCQPTYSAGGGCDADPEDHDCLPCAGCECPFGARPMMRDPRRVSPLRSPRNGRDRRVLRESDGSRLPHLPLPLQLGTHSPPATAATATPPSAGSAIAPPSAPSSDNWPDCHRRHNPPGGPPEGWTHSLGAAAAESPPSWPLPSRNGGSWTVPPPPFARVHPGSQRLPHQRRCVPPSTGSHPVEHAVVLPRSPWPAHSEEVSLAPAP
jgi:hypothetical protein